MSNKTIKIMKRVAVATNVIRAITALDRVSAPIRRDLENFDKIYNPANPASVNKYDHAAQGIRARMRSLNNGKKR